MTRCVAGCHCEVRATMATLRNRGCPLNLVLLDQTSSVLPEPLSVSAVNGIEASRYACVLNRQYCALSALQYSVSVPHSAHVPKEEQWALIQPAPPHVASVNLKTPPRFPSYPKCPPDSRKRVRRLPVGSHQGPLVQERKSGTGGLELRRRRTSAHGSHQPRCLKGEWGIAGAGLAALSAHVCKSSQFAHPASRPVVPSSHDILHPPPTPSLVQSSCPRYSNHTSPLAAYQHSNTATMASPRA